MKCFNFNELLGYLKKNLALVIVSITISGCLTELGDDESGSQLTTAEPIIPSINVIPEIPASINLSNIPVDPPPTGTQIVPQISTQDIYVVKIDGEGLITEDLTTLFEITENSDVVFATTSFTLIEISETPETPAVPPSLDTLILADASLSANISVGQPIPDGVLYSPLFNRLNEVTGVNTVTVDPASTAIMRSYIDLVSSISNTVIQELAQLTQFVRTFGLPSPQESITNDGFSRWLNNVSGFLKAENAETLTEITATPSNIVTATLGRYANFRSGIASYRSVNSNDLSIRHSNGEVLLAISDQILSANIFASALSPLNGENFLNTNFAPGNASFSLTESAASAGYLSFTANESEQFNRLVYTNTPEVFSGSPPVDSDNDGVPDGVDAFPNDPTEFADSDGDGVGDFSDAFPNDPTETADSDGDGTGDNADNFPDDPAQTKPVLTSNKSELPLDSAIFYNAVNVLSYDDARSIGGLISTPVHGVCEINNPTQFLSACNSGDASQVTAIGLNFSTQIAIEIGDENLSYDLSVINGLYGVVRNDYSILTPPSTEEGFREAVSVYTATYTDGTSTNITPAEQFLVAFDYDVGDGVNNNTQQLLPSFTESNFTPAGTTFSEIVLANQRAVLTAAEFPNSIAATTPQTAMLGHMNFDSDENSGNREIGQMTFVKLPVSFEDSILDDNAYSVIGHISIIDPNNIVNRCQITGRLFFDIDSDESQLIINAGCINDDPTTVLRGSPVATSNILRTAIRQSLSIAPTNPTWTSASGEINFGVQSNISYTSDGNLSIPLPANLAFTGFVQEGAELMIMKVSGDGRATNASSAYGVLYAIRDN